MSLPLFQAIYGGIFHHSTAKRKNPENQYAHKLINHKLLSECLSL
jgi:hypothetical protein